MSKKTPPSKAFAKKIEVEVAYAKASLRSKRLQYASKLVRETATALAEAPVGCTDGSCVFGYAGGMHTNGGCQCHRDISDIEVRRNLQLLSRTARALGMRLLELEDREGVEAPDDE